MDPSKKQPDNSDDAHSLEGTGTIVESDKNTGAQPDNTSAGPAAEISDARSGSADSPSRNTSSGKDSRPPLFKRIWQKFNIYLLLFILVILIGVAVTVVLFFKNRTATKQTESVINSQNLSEEALKQLANTSVNVGNSKQILNVESNAIFAGSVLVRSNLEVAGTIKVGGELQLPSITVTGASRFSNLQADTLAIGSSATVQGVFTAQKGIAVTGNSTFNGALSAASITTNTLQLNGELVLTNHLTVGGPTPGVNRGSAVGSGGTASLSGSDTSGSITVNTGSGTGAGCFATVVFARKFNSTPHVVVTPIGSGAAGVAYYVNRSSTEFSVCTANPAPTGQTFGFDYMVLS